MVNVDIDTVNCHAHGRANFRPHVNRVFTTRLTCRDADVPEHVLYIFHFDFKKNSHTFMRLHATSK